MWTHFNLNEFDSPDEPGSGTRMEHKLLDMLDVARSISGCSYKITSGYRTKNHNKKVGGTPNSSHLRGKAADISCSTSTERFKIISGLIAAGFTRIGIGQNFVHVDIDTYKTPNVTWLYA